jgi:hypothetical protein
MPVNVVGITQDRLAQWALRLETSHATPVLLVGVGHDHVSGQIVICVTEERTDKEILALLKKAVRELGG